MTNFSTLLNEYIQELDCSGADLAARADLSAAAISRYRSGERAPKRNSEIIDKLAKGICSLAGEKQLQWSEDDICDALNNALTGPEKGGEHLAEHLDLLISSLQINLSALAKTLNFDTSYLSRIRTGQRTPANTSDFIEKICQFVVRKYADPESLKIMASLLDIPMNQLNEDTYLRTLIDWFDSDLKKDTQHIDHFLKNLDEFNLDEYIKAIHFDELKVPTMPFRLPASRNYYGIEQMRQGELDFFKNTVLSKSMEPIFMCSDMPMADMAEDVDFGKKWMFAIAMSLKKGLHLNIIHNIDRPFSEMMLGLESWIPIYMTGQVSPYHLKGVSTTVYHHLNYVSGAAALCGECINGSHGDGKYYLTNNKEEVAYYKKKAQALLAKALPLMEIYRSTESLNYKVFQNTAAGESGCRRNMLSSLPLYTIQRDLLEKILTRHGITSPEKEQLAAYADEQQKIMQTILKENEVRDEIFYLSPQEFEQHPMVLSLSGAFYEKEITYTYEEYCEHLEQTKQFEKEYKHYHVHIIETPIFNHIQIQILENKWVVISKNKTPCIHFVIRHPKMVRAIQDFSAPVIENPDNDPY